MGKSGDILIVYLGSSGGGVLDTFEIAESLSKHGGNRYSVLISANNPFKEQFERLPLGRIFVEETHTAKTSDFVLKTLMRSRIRRIARSIRASGAGLILFTMEHAWMWPLISRLKQSPRRPLLCYIRHNPSGFVNGRSDVRDRLLSFVERRIIRNVDCIFTLSEHVRRATIKEFGTREDKVINIGLGSHTSLCKHWKHHGFAEGGRVRLLFFGRILPYKGVEVLVKAFIRMREQRLPVELTVAGEGKIGEALLVGGQRAGVRYVNRWLDDSELCCLLSDTDVVVLPYNEASQSGPAGIAAGLGIPIIASNVGGLAEQVVDGENGILVQPGSADAICRAVKTFVDRPELLREYSNRTKRLSDKQFSWREKGNRLDAIFSELINAA